MKMGNQKNRRNHGNSHRHVFVHRKPPQKYTKSIQASTVAQPPHTPTVTIEGSRVINVMKLQQYINELTVHSTQCGGSVVLTGEARDGLASIMSSHCSTCNHTITLETAQKVKGPRGYRRWECNLAAVWGQMVTGGGHS